MSAAHASSSEALAAAAGALANCTYRYDLNDSVMRALSLYLDGPFTLVAALLALVGAHFAVKFLGQAGLNRDLTAALYTLCFCDAFFIFTVMLYHSIEATGILVTGHNVMWNEQKLVLYTHALVSAATTASTLLVVYITFQRFLVVIWPLRYARVCEPLVVFVAFALNGTVFFEFELADCYMFEVQMPSQHLHATSLRQSQTYNAVRTAVMMVTQTIGPISVITLLTVITEYKVHLSLRARRSLFESQHRRRSVVMVEELRERLSRTVAIFIAVKFLILRSLPIFFDIYETFYGIESFGIVLSVLVRLSDFGIVLNAATNSLAYFGKARWLEAKLRDRLLRKRQTPSAGSRWSAYSKSLVTAAKPSFDFSGKKTSTATMAERPFVTSPTAVPPRPPSAPPIHARNRAALPLRSAPTSPINAAMSADEERERLLDSSGGAATATPSPTGDCYRGRIGGTVISTSPRVVTVVVPNVAGDENNVPEHGDCGSKCNGGAFPAFAARPPTDHDTRVVATTVVAQNGTVVNGVVGVLPVPRFQKAPITI